MTVALLLRFLEKYKFKMDVTQMALIAHIDWRIEEDVGQVSIVTSAPATIYYLDQGLFRFFKTDYIGRPVAYICPSLFLPDTVKTTEDLKNALILSLETLRRWIHAIGERNLKVYQALVVINLDGFGVSNMVYGYLIAGLWIDTSNL